MRTRTKKFLLPLAGVILLSCLWVISLEAAKEKKAGIRTTKASDITILELNQQIQDKRNRASAIRRQIAVYEQNIRQRQAEAASLENQIAIIEDNAAKTQLDLEATEVEIEQLGLEVEQATAQIDQQQAEIDMQK